MEIARIFYRIRRLSDGFYSAGGSWPHFKKTGKTWQTKSALTNHLKLVGTYDGKKGLGISTYDGCEIEVIKIIERVDSTIPVLEYAKAKGMSIPTAK